MNKNLGCVSCSRGFPIKICLSIKLEGEHKIRYISFSDTSRLSNLIDLVKKYNLQKILIQKEHSFIIEKISDVEIELIDRSDYNGTFSTGLDYFTNCAISALLIYLKSPDLVIEQDYLENRCFIFDDTNDNFFEIVNYTSTKYGQRKLKLDLIQPFINIEDIKRRHDLLIYFRENSVLALKIEKILKSMPDIEKIISSNQIKDLEFKTLKNNIYDVIKIGRFINSYMALKVTSEMFKHDLCTVKDAISVTVKLEEVDIREMVDIFNSNIDEYLDLAIKIHKETRNDLGRYLANLDLEFEFTITKYNNNESALKISNFNMIKNNFGTSKYQKSDGLTKTVESKYKNSHKSFDKIHSEPWIKNSSIHYHKTEHNLSAISSMSRQELNSDQKSISELTKTQISNDKSDELIILATKKEYFLATTRELQNFNYKIRESLNQIIEIGGKLCGNLLISVNHNIKDLFDVIEEISEIDVCLSSYRFSIKHDCCVPKIDDHICILSSYHPLIKQEKIVYNDFFSCSFLRFNILTGPNMSGKSAYMKQLYYQCVLNQIGYPIIAKNATLKIFKSIYLKSNNHKHPTDIFKFFENIKLNEDSLVLMDEIGKGIEYNQILLTYLTFSKILINSKAFTVLITHYKEIINYIKHHQCVNVLKNEDFKVSNGVSKETEIPKICLKYLNLNIVKEMENYKQLYTDSDIKFDNRFANIALKIKKATEESEIKDILNNLRYNIHD
ncbi:hypothetical protein P3W45_001124 [Vairimorpha bombi]|jgi:DNA mismatch repair protein MSH4